MYIVYVQSVKLLIFATYCQKCVIMYVLLRLAYNIYYTVVSCCLYVVRYKNHVLWKNIYADRRFVVSNWCYRQYQLVHIIILMKYSFSSNEIIMITVLVDLVTNWVYR